MVRTPSKKAISIFGLFEYISLACHTIGCVFVQESCQWYITWPIKALRVAILCKLMYCKLNMCVICYVEPFSSDFRRNFARHKHRFAESRNTHRLTLKKIGVKTQNPTDMKFSFCFRKNCYFPFFPTLLKLITTWSQTFAKRISSEVAMTFKFICNTCIKCWAYDNAHAANICMKLVDYILSCLRKKPIYFVRKNYPST